MSFANRFKKMQGRWDKEQATSGSSHPDGKFQGKISKAQLTEGKQGKRKGHVLCVFTITGLVGDAKGKRCWITCDLDFEHDRLISRVDGEMPIYLEVTERPHPRWRGLRRAVEAKCRDHATVRQRRESVLFNFRMLPAS